MWMVLLHLHVNLNADDDDDTDDQNICSGCLKGTSLLCSGSLKVMSHREVSFKHTENYVLIGNTENNDLEEYIHLMTNSI